MSAPDALSILNPAPKGWLGPQPPATPLDAAIIFAPIRALLPLALLAVRKRGRVV